MQSAHISEIFASMQGEGQFTGKPSIWVRFFACNLKCDGFGQLDPTNPATYQLPYKTVDLTYIKSMADLPVFETGCDSSYSWCNRFKHLTKKYTTEEIILQILALDKAIGLDFKKNKSWITPNGHVKAQLCFTGGEPMLYQIQINEICKMLADKALDPPQITIETNATIPLKNLKTNLYIDHSHFSCSPKLYAVSGEKNGINLDVIEEYIEYANSGILKFVHNGSEAAWQELDNITQQLTSLMYNEKWEIWIMPVHSTIEKQTVSHISPIVKAALARGYSISLRNHVFAFGNGIGT